MENKINKSIEKDIPFLADFINFLKSPSEFLNYKSDLSVFSKVWKVIQIVAFSGVVSYLLVLTTNYLTNILGYSQEGNNSVGDFINQYPPIVSLAFVVLLGPLSEELAFRLPLSSIKKIFWTGLYFLIFFLFPILVELLPVGQDIKDTLSFLSVVLPIPVILYLGMFTNFEPVKNFIEKNFKFLVYFLAITFGLIHLGNYQNLVRYWYLSPLLIISQIFAGFVFSYSRLKFGFFYAFLTHSIYNFAFTISVVLYTIVLGNDKFKTIADTLNSGKFNEFGDILSAGDKNSIAVINIFLVLQFGLIFFLFLKTIFDYFRYVLKTKNILEV